MDVVVPSQKISRLQFSISFVHGVAFIDSFGLNPTIVYIINKVDGKQVSRTPIGPIAEIKLAFNIYFVFVSAGTSIPLTKGIL